MENNNQIQSKPFIPSTLSETPRWELAANLASQACFINRFVKGLFELSPLSLGNSLYYTAATLRKFTFLIVTWEFSDLAKTTGKALFCFAETIYLPFAFALKPTWTINKHNDFFGKTTTTQDAIQDANALWEDVVNFSKDSAEKLKKELVKAKEELVRVENFLIVSDKAIENMQRSTEKKLKKAKEELVEVKNSLALTQNRVNELNAADKNTNEIVEQEKELASKKEQNLKDKILELEQQLNQIQLENTNTFKEQNDNHEKIKKELEEINKNTVLTAEEQLTEKNLTIKTLTGEQVESQNKIKPYQIKQEKNINLLKENEKNITLQKEQQKTLEDKITRLTNELESRNNKIDILETLLKEKTRIIDQKKEEKEEIILLDDIFNDETEYENFTVNYDITDLKETDNIINSSSKQNENEEDYLNPEDFESVIIFEDETQQDGFFENILNKLTGSETTKQQQAKNDQEPLLREILKQIQKLERGTEEFDSTEEIQINHDINKIIDQLKKHSGTINYNSNPLKNQEVQYAPNYQCKINGNENGSEAKIEILKGSSKLDSVDPRFQGKRMMINGSKEDEKITEEAIRFAQEFESIIQLLTKNDSGLDDESKRNLQNNFPLLAQAAHQHCTKGNGVNIYKCIKKNFTTCLGNRDKNPLGLTPERVFDKLHTNFSIENGFLCIEQTAYVQLMIPYCGSKKIGTGLYSKVTTLTKISLSDPSAHPIMTGTFTNYISIESQLQIETPTVKSQESYWSSLMGLIFNKEGEHKNQKYKLSLDVIEKGFKKGLGLDLTNFKKNNGLKTNSELNLKTLLGIYTQKKSEKTANPLEEKILEILELLTNEKIDIRSQYHQFVTLLRQGLKTETYQSALLAKRANKPYDYSIDILLNMCYYRFAENEMYGYLEDLVNDHILMGLDPNCNTKKEKIKDEITLEQEFEAIEAAPSELKGNLGILTGLAKSHTFYFDPHTTPNVPQTYGKFKLYDKELTWLRMGTPTNQYLFSTENNKEFEGFLEVLGFKKQKLLYINLQNEQAKTIENESVRVQEMRKLAEKYPEVYQIVTLAYNSDFYKQSGEKYGIEKVSVDDFIDQFKAALFSNEDGYYFPDSWKKDDEFTKMLEETLGDVKNLFFHEHKELSIAERKDFISLCYPLLSIRLNKWHESDYFLAVCKDNKDRGGQLNGLMFQMIGAIAGCSDEVSFKKKLRTIIHAPALMITKGAILKKHERRKRATTAYNRLNKNSILKRFSTYKKTLENRYGIHDKESILNTEKSKNQGWNKNISLKNITSKEPLEIVVDGKKLNIYLQQDLGKLGMKIDNEKVTGKIVNIFDRGHDLNGKKWLELIIINGAHKTCLVEWNS